MFIFIVISNVKNEGYQLTVRKLNVERRRVTTKNVGQVSFI